MTDSRRPGLKITAKGSQIYRARWIVVAVAPLLSAAILVAVAVPFKLEEFSKQGLLQPAVAAFLALSIVLSMRLTWGRYSNERRKGVLSASSASIAVRLWAMCFSVIFGAMLLSALATHLPDRLGAPAPHEPKSVETHIEVKPAGAPPAVTSVKVTQ